MPELARDTLVDGRYRVIRRLGAGGMAEVYCAEDQQLGRQVALKLLYRRFAEDDEFVERFRREASAAAGLQHPNIVMVHRVGVHEAQHYFSLDYFEGQRLALGVSNGPLPSPAAARLVAEPVGRARMARVTWRSTSARSPWCLACGAAAAKASTAVA